MQSVVDASGRNVFVYMDGTPWFEIQVSQGGGEADSEPTWYVGPTASIRLHPIQDDGAARAEG